MFLRFLTDICFRLTLTVVPDVLLVELPPEQSVNDVQEEHHLEPQPLVPVQLATPEDSGSSTPKTPQD